MHQSKILEAVEYGSLARLLHDEIHVDQYKSKMGEDSDIIVISFKITGKDPALDLVDFIEKGYDFVLDADTSAGELDDGDFIVFVEIERTPDAVDYIIKMVDELKNLSGIALDKWRWRYHKDIVDRKFTEEELKKVIPLTPDEYNNLFKRNLDDLKTASGIDVDTKAPVDEFTESLRIAAGIK